MVLIFYFNDFIDLFKNWTSRVKFNSICRFFCRAIFSNLYNLNAIIFYGTQWNWRWKKKFFFRWNFSVVPWREVLHGKPFLLYFQKKNWIFFLGFCWMIFQYLAKNYNCITWKIINIWKNSKIKYNKTKFLLTYKCIFTTTM